MKSSSYIDILLKRIEIRCAMWAMDLIDEKTLDDKLSRINAFAHVIETNQSSSVGMFWIDVNNAEVFLARLDMHNKELLEAHFK